MRYLLTLILSSSSILGFSQKLTLYYNDQGELTIPALSSHFRAASFDSLFSEFDGTSYEYNADSVLIGIYEYERGTLAKLDLITKTDTTNYDPSQLGDSLSLIVENKNSYSQATYIRKNEYKQILSKLSALQIEYPTDSIEWEGKKVPTRQVYTIVEDPASFPGGMDTMVKFLSYYLVYPQPAQDAGITGKVYVEFVVNKNGTISDILVTKGIGYGCDEAAIYAISQLPDWKPGYQRGEPVRSKMTMPITFQ